ncbi:vertnin [Plakobranchus ocellatus]|uniref:Vertnin n=1 Tax=Plakobranchus ocellatus TaxID=259542 RepID=A0AAV4BX61_9GAST|nr:vertnin [Plakobranchus ocellatus]
MFRGKTNAIKDEDYGHYRNTACDSAWDKIKLANARPDGLEDPSQGLPKDRANFFDVAQKKLCSIKSFRGFKYNYEQLLTLIHVAEFYLPKPCIFVRDLKCADDKIELILRPSLVAEHCVPFVTVGDGNCMPRNLCLTFSGSDSWHKEIRCRIAIELALNAEHYLDEGKLSSACDGEPKTCKFLRVISKLSDSTVSDDENDINVTSAFQAESMKMCVPCTYMGMWQLCPAATVLNIKIISVYPSLGWGVFQNLHKRVVKPRKRISPNSIPITWSSSRNDMVDKN